MQSIHFNPSIAKDDMPHFAFFSANLHKLLPHLPYSQHQLLFSQATYYDTLEADDERNMSHISAALEPKAFLESLNQPGFIATYHFGPYRWLSMWLMKKRIPFSLLIAEEVYQAQHERYREIYRQVTGNAVEDGLDFLIAEDPGVFYKMREKLKQGHFLLVYIDGNSGSGKLWQNKHSDTVLFSEAKLQVRTGFAHAAFLYDVPIYPVIAAFNSESLPYLNTLPAINRMEQSNRAYFVKQVMQLLYGNLAGQLREQPAQWEGMHYIHHHYAADSIRGNAFFHYFVPFKLKENHYLLHKPDFSLYKITSEIYDRLLVDFN